MRFEGDADDFATGFDFGMDVLLQVVDWVGDAVQGVEIGDAGFCQGEGQDGGGGN